MRESRLIGLAAGIAALVVLMALPALIVVAFYVFANVYAIITGTDFGSNTIDVGVFLTGLVLSVATFVVLMAVAVNLIGRSLSPKRPKDRIEEPGF